MEEMLPSVLVMFYAPVMNDRPASWRMPTREQMEKLSEEFLNHMNHL